MKRRTFLKSTGFAGIALAAPTYMVPTHAAGSVDIYGVKSLSGPFASFGKFANMGSELAAKDYGKVLGKDVVYRTIDTEGNAGKGVRKVQEAIQQDGARFFVGCTLSSTALAVGKEINKTDGVFITPAGADEITGAECNPATFRWSVPTYGAIRETVGPLAALKPNAKRWYTITPQYVFGEALLRNAKAVFDELGVEHVGNSYHSLQEQEFSGYLTNATAAKPDVLLLLNFGSQSSNALRQALNFGLHKRMDILLAWSAGLDQFKELGSELMSGIYMGAQYWHQAESSMNSKLVARSREVYGINPPYPFAADYIGTWLILDAIAKAGDTDGTAVQSAMAGVSYQGPTGNESIRAADHQVIKDYYLLRGKHRSKMKDEDDFVDIISAGKSFPSPEALECKMA